MTELANLSYRVRDHQEALFRWKERIQAWKESGLTQKDWCRANHVCMTSFSTWKRRIEETENRKVTSNDLVDISFALDNPAATIQGAGLQEWMGSIAATIEFRRVKVHVYEGASAGTLRSIMEAIDNA